MYSVFYAFSGIVSKAPSSSSGGGNNHLCLSLNPDSATADDAFRNEAYITGVVYQETASEFIPAELRLQPVPCAVCEVQQRAVVMVPGSRSCGEGWRVEYEGVLMSEANAGQSSNFVCVSRDMQGLAHAERNDNGEAGQLHVVEAKCGTLPCPPFAQGQDVSCVVCSK